MKVKNTTIRSCGVTDIYENDRTITVSHGGNMGARMKDIDKNLVRLGLPTIKEMKAKYSYRESGSPDYQYKIVFNKLNHA